MCMKVDVLSMTLVIFVAGLLVSSVAMTFEGGSNLPPSALQQGVLQP